MSNESNKLYSSKKESEKLVAIYNDILSDKTEPSSNTQKKFLLQLLNTKISQLEPRTNRIKRINYALKISVMIFSALSTIILGLKIKGVANWSDISSNTALVITAAVTFLSGLAVFWDTENYWIRNKIMLNKLKELRYEYVFYLEGHEKTNPSEMRSFLDKFLSALGDEYWEKFLKDIKSNDPKPEINKPI
jgi:hypothetical protein